MTYGERAVGLSFNPGSNPQVTAIKAAYATIIDQLDAARSDLKKDTSEDRGEAIRLFSVAITEAQSAQMWAVKAVTWQ